MNLSWFLSAATVAILVRLFLFCVCFFLAQVTFKLQCIIIIRAFFFVSHTFHRCFSFHIQWPISMSLFTWVYPLNKTRNSLSDRFCALSHVIDHHVFFQCYRHSFPSTVNQICYATLTEYTWRRNWKKKRVNVLLNLTRFILLAGNFRR